MSDPQLGRLSIDASNKEVQDRYGRLVAQRRPGVPEAFNILRSPAKRLGYDIFQTSLDQQQQTLEELLTSPLSLEQPPPTLPDFAHPDFLVLDITPSTTQFTPQETTFALSIQYEDVGNLLNNIHFDI